MVVAMDRFERLLKRAGEVEKYRTGDCLDLHLLGLLAEKKLSPQAEEGAKEHVRNCLYCLKRLSDLQELLYHERHPTSLSPGLTARLKALKRMGAQSGRKESRISRLVEGLKGVIDFPAKQWRYVAAGLAGACLAVLVGLVHTRPDASFPAGPTVDRNAFVRVAALDESGTVVNEAQGVVVSGKGLVASNLHNLQGARVVEIRLKDGRTTGQHAYGRTRTGISPS